MGCMEVELNKTAIGAIPAFVISSAQTGGHSLRIRAYSNVSIFHCGTARDE